jgi:hypothetical protein
VTTGRDLAPRIAPVLTRFEIMSSPSRSWVGGR